MLTDKELVIIERDIGIAGSSDDSAARWRMLDIGTKLLAEVRRLRAGTALDLVKFRAFFDFFGIDYHVENHHGPNGSPIAGAARSIELGSQVEFAFDADGRFLGWIEIADSETLVPKTESCTVGAQCCWCGALRTS